MTGRERHPNYQRIYRIVRRIPRGRVATYGQVAALAGLPGHARQVGYALHRLRPEERAPWHRVVNAAGRISTRSSEGGSETIQRKMLEAEGVKFGKGGEVDLERFRWAPKAQDV